VRQPADVLVKRLQSIVGPGCWVTDPKELEPFITEWRDEYRGATPIMVLPDSVEKVSEIVRTCRELGTPIVPQGGNTGLCGGAIPSAEEPQVLLCLSKMNKIRSVSADDHSMVAEAGVTLLEIQQAAVAVDRFFPLSLAAEGSCQIGGNLSTNAGGINVLRYGTARDLALGLEVVLADGQVWNGLKSLRKDTAGFDLKHLFIGAEGTLGIITAASLRLFPALCDTSTAIVSVDSPHDAVRLLSILRRELLDQVQAFELIPDRAVRYVLRHIPSNRFALDSASPWFVLIEALTPDDPGRFENALMSCLESGHITDASIAKNHNESEQMWRLRHAISEAQKLEGASLKHDVSVPVGSVAEFIDAAEKAVSQALPGTRVVAFGHVGDGNIHFNLSQPRTMDAKDFLAQRNRLAEVVYDVVTRFSGSISAEHGIGMAKRKYLYRYKSETDVTLMKTIKHALDPENLLNPGKVI
jgi:FAD/FMN-containing dehydrogenase